MAFCNPYPIARRAAALAAALVFLAMLAPPAHAQRMSFIRDTEIERLLREYEDPLLLAAGLSPASVKMYIVNDPTLNAFVAGGQNIFVHTGLIMELERPDQLIGVLAHETGHISGGHLARSGEAIAAASVPMLVSVGLGALAIIAGAPDAGMGIMAAGSQVATRQFYQFTRSQESSADQAAIRYLNATRQSPQGMIEVFEKFAGQEMLTQRSQDPYAYTHPMSRERIAALEQLVAEAPYRNMRGTPAQQHAYDMVRAKLHGYVERPEIALRRYPGSDTSKPARYARAVAYFRMPDIARAMSEIDSLLAEEPGNPYFLEVKGQLLVEMGRPREGIEPYRKAVQQLPDAPLLRVALAAALLATEDEKHIREALEEIKSALRLENDNSFAWFEAAQAYSRLGQPAMADLATAERFYAAGNMGQAIQFARRAQMGLDKTSTDWQRANDILTIAAAEMQNRQR